MWSLLFCEHPSERRNWWSKLFASFQTSHSGIIFKTEQPSLNVIYIFFLHVYFYTFLPVCDGVLSTNCDSTSVWCRLVSQWSARVLQSQYKRTWVTIYFIYFARQQATQYLFTTCRQFYKMPKCLSSISLLYY